MLTSLACFLVALALAPSLFVQVAAASVPLAPITVGPYPSPGEPVGTLRENTNHDIFDVMNLSEAEASPTANSKGNIPKYEYTYLQAFANIYLCCPR